MDIDTSHVSFIVPAFNEAERLQNFITRLTAFLVSAETSSNLPQSFTYSIVVIDDGSKYNIQLVTEQREVRIYLLRHCENLGQGAALQTGVEYARDQLSANYFVTMDADGQHAPEDFPPMFNKLLTTNFDIIFGDRFGTGSNIPRSRHFILTLAKRFENLITGIKLNDAHNGYRVFQRTFAQKLKLTQNRMAHATEFKATVSKYGFSYGESKVKITYSADTLQKGQSNLGSLKILRDLISGYFLERD